MKLFPLPGQEVCLRGSTLVLPAVAFANIGELAIDVLITNMGGTLVARCDDDNLLAAVGNNAYHPSPPGLLATTLELYALPGGGSTFVLQQRAPAIPGRQAAFAAGLANWAAEQGVAALLLLSGLDGAYRTAQQLDWTGSDDAAADGSSRRSSKLRHLDWASSALLTAAGAGAAGASAATAPAGGDSGAGGGGSSGSSNNNNTPQGGGAGGVMPLLPQPCPLTAAAAAAGVPVLEPSALSVELETHSLLPPWPLLTALLLGARRSSSSSTITTTTSSSGGGSAGAQGIPSTAAVPTAEAAHSASSSPGAVPPATLLAAFAAEGDNTSDALELAAAARDVLVAAGALGAAAAAAAATTNPADLRVPCSWAGLYGRGFDESLF